MDRKDSFGTRVEYGPLGENHIRISLSKSLVDRPDNQTADIALLEKVIQSVPQGKLKQSLEQKKGYGFRCFRRRSDGQPNVIIDGNVVPDSTYDKAVESIKKTGIESASSWSREYILQDRIYEWFFLPLPEAVKNGEDISMMLIYKDDAKKSLFGILEVRWV